MSHCINPNCPHPQNPDNILFCQTCGSELLLVGRYRVSRLLSGKGGFGRTYEVSQGNTTKVLKVLINHQAKAIELFQQEARVLQQLNHPGIPKGDRYFTFLPRNSQQPLHCLVMERIEGLDLEEYQKQRQYHPIDQQLALEWLLQLAQILDEVHQQQFFHRDIKPSNIILRPDGQLVLIDFGTVREVTATYKIKQRAGQVTGIASVGYTPPEQLHYQAVLQSDFFALGRTFVFLLTGKQPTDPAIYDPINDQFNWRSHTPNIVPELADFIDQLMMRSASQRPADTQVILQRLAEIDRILNPPLPPRRKPPKVAATVPSSPTSPALQSFDFEVITVDYQGRVTNRDRTQAECFTQDLGNGVILEMVAIPGSKFLMGSPATEKKRRDNESPQHEVTIQPFFMGKYTVTQAQWKAVTAVPKVNRNLKASPSRFKGVNFPVEQVSWYDAVEFCTRLSIKTGRNYRLPSEAEWEYACRAGTTTPFH
ncbi:MAG: SUMF1/EgtB/PvdO family nonheme iron enzyme, partial [Symploca sp. SIO1A3]|nr:SUMF1/EgtB/PvdO family nonheme iron enzyme [Symploca sp. SIO1A3]